MTTKFTDRYGFSHRSVQARVICALYHNAGMADSSQHLEKLIHEIKLPYTSASNIGSFSLPRLLAMGYVEYDQKKYNNKGFAKVNIRLVAYDDIEDDIVALIDDAKDGHLEVIVHNVAIPPIPTTTLNPTPVADLANEILARIGRLLEIEQQVDNGELVPPDDDRYVQEELVDVKHRLGEQTEMTQRNQRMINTQNETIAAHVGTISKLQQQISEYKSKIDNLEANIAKMTSSNRVDDRTFGQLDRIVRSAPGSMKGDDDNG